MMKCNKLAIIVILFAAVTATHGAIINWQTDGDYTSGLLGPSGSMANPSWVLWMYQDDDGALPSYIGTNGVPSDGGARLPASSYSMDVGAAFSYLYNLSYIDSELGLGIGDKIYTVIFDATNIASAMRYAIVDDSVFTIPDYYLSPAFSYDIGSIVAGDWSWVPGTVLERRPTFEWTASSSNATYYYIWLERNSVAYYDKWIQQTNTSWQIDVDLPAGSYEWWVRGWGDGDWAGLWSSVSTFGIPVMIPTNTVLRSPSGDITTNRPEFAWHSATNATWYNLWINKNGTPHFQKWLQETNYTLTADLLFGEYRWWVRTWSPDGYGPWSDPFDFTYGVSAPTSPTGTVTGTRQPTFTWTQVPDATWYHLWLNQGQNSLLDEWVKGSNSWTFSTELEGTNYSWWIRAWNNADQHAPWSDGATFAISNDIPENIVQVAPTGTVSGTSVTYSWQADDAATWYQLWTGASNVKHHAEWYHTGIVTGSVSRTVTGHSIGATYNWWVQGWGPDGQGQWSSGATFTVTD